jgi:hypothetical protein
MTRDKDTPSAGELLAEWRAREREMTTADMAVRVAKTAMLAATEAQEAARESEVAANSAMEAANASRRAAERAKKAASMAAGSAEDAVVTAEGDHARAAETLESAQTAERTARERFQEIQDRKAHEHGI